MQTTERPAQPSRVSSVRRFVTRRGRELPFTSMGFGSAPLGNYLRPLAEDDCDATLEAAWDAGMRYFDTAPFYGFGLSEQRIGRLLKKVGRKEYVISTKVGRLFEPCAPDEVNSPFFVDTPQVRFYYDYSYDGVMRSYEESLGRLGIDNVDILYVHDVDAFCHGGREGSEKAIQDLLNHGGWRALCELRDSGDVAAIGAGVAVRRGTPGRRQRHPGRPERLGDYAKRRAVEPRHSRIVLDRPQGKRPRACPRTGTGVMRTAG